MKKIALISLGLLISSCSPLMKSEAFRGLSKPDLDNLLVSYNQNGYTKKTEFFLTEEIRNDTKNFHAGANTPKRATYYNSAEDALIMGDYDGELSTINSGYRNIEGGVQHFEHVGKVSASNLFSSIKDDWSMMDQFVGKYYPTLTSLSSLDGINDWEYVDGTFVYSISDISDITLQKFQYFAAPMLLINDTFHWTSIKIKDNGDNLTIKLYSSNLTYSTVIENEEALISSAIITKGLNVKETSDD